MSFFFIFFFIIITIIIFIYFFITIITYKRFCISFKTIYIIAKERPDFVVTTGTMVAIPMCVLLKLFRKKVIYIETFSRVTNCTRAGKFMYGKADLFIYQWEQLAKYYPDGVYGGSIY